MTVRFFQFFIFLQLALAQIAPAQGSIVKAEDHSSFWIWGGIRSQPALAEAKELYILQGQVAENRKQGVVKIAVMPQGMPTAKIKKGKVWIVYRVTTLNWPPDIMQALNSQLVRWEKHGNDVVGLQLDFDAGTKNLHKYAQFLRQVRAVLPAKYKLGITGLLDWAGNGDPEALGGLNSIADEIVIQTYQGRNTVPNYQAYLPALKRLKLPFKIGLIQNGDWQPAEEPGSIPMFRGYVVFLQNKNR